MEGSRIDIDVGDLAISGTDVRQCTPIIDLNQDTVLYYHAALEGECNEGESYYTYIKVSLLTDAITPDETAGRYEQIAEIPISPCEVNYKYIETIFKICVYDYDQMHLMCASNSLPLYL